MLVSIFWICCGLLLYVYVLYPLLVGSLAARFGKAVKRGDALPSITIVVTAYNEEKCIQAKLENLTALSYPAALVDVIVASDGSTDATEELAAAFPGRVSVLRVEGRCGKTACQNAAALAASGDVVVFTDATTRLHPA